MTMRGLGMIASVLLLVVLMWPLRGGFTDDGYIHIQYAQNIVARGEYSFNPGHVSFGTTSPLWVMVQAAIGRIFGVGETLVTSSRLLSWLMGILSVLAIVAFARRAGLDGWMAFLCTFTFAAHCWFVRWTSLAMETSASVLAMIAVGTASIGALQRDRMAWRFGFCAALASLVRPEAYLIVPVYLATALLDRSSARLGCVLRTLAMYAALVAPWLVFARIHIGRFLPNTAGAKSGGMVTSPLTLAGKFVPMAKIVASAELVPVVLIIAAAVVLRAKSRLFSRELRFLVLWVIALPFAYAIFDIQVLSRYMLLVSPFVVVLGFVALHELASLGRLARARRTVTAAVAAVAIVLNVVFYMIVVVPPSRAFSEDLTHTLRSLALHLHDTSAEDAVVAAADIGYLAFYSQREVLDLGGLVDNTTAELRERHTYEEIIERGLYLQLPEYPRVDYFIDRVPEPNRFDGRTMHGYRFESVRVELVRNLGIRKPGPFYYTLYRLHHIDHDES